MGNYYIGSITSKYRQELWHYGVPNQKWGVRNYQNLDGSLTLAGRAHYGIGPGHSDDENDPDSAANQIASLKGKLQDPATEKELDYYISNVKSGRMSAEQALAAAQQAVELDKQRAEYRAKKAAAEEKKKQAAAKKAAKAKAKRRSSSGSSGSSKSSKSEDKKKKKEYNTEWIDRDTQQRNLIGRIESILRGATSGDGNVNANDILSQLRSALGSSGSSGYGVGPAFSTIASRASQSGSGNNATRLQGAYNDIMQLIQKQQRASRPVAVRRRSF